MNKQQWLTLISRNRNFSQFVLDWYLQVEMTQLVKLRSELRAACLERGIKLSYMPFIVKVLWNHIPGVILFLFDFLFSRPAHWPSCTTPSWTAHWTPKQTPSPTRRRTTLPWPWTPPWACWCPASRECRAFPSLRLPSSWTGCSNLAALANYQHQTSLAALFLSGEQLKIIRYLILYIFYLHLAILEALGELMPSLWYYLLRLILQSFWSSFSSKSIW